MDWIKSAFILGLMLNSALIAGTSTFKETEVMRVSSNDNPCIEELDVVLEYEIGWQLDEPNIHTTEDCQSNLFKMSYNANGPFIQVAMTSLNEKLYLTELFSGLNINISNSQFHNTEIDRLDPNDCGYIIHCRYPEILLDNSKTHGITMPLAWALNENISISDKDHIRVEIKNTYQPTNISRIAWNCGSSQGGVFNLENVTSLDSDNYTGFQSYRRILNPSSSHELLDYSFSHNMVYDQWYSCTVNLFIYGTDEEFSEWTFNTTQYMDSSRCGGNFRVLGISHQNKYLMVDAGQFGVFVADLDSKTSTKINSDGHGVKYHWAPNSNNLFYTNYSNSDLMIYNPDLDVSEKVIEFDEIRNIIGPSITEWYIGMSNLFDDKTLFLAWNSGFAQIIFSESLDSYDVTQIWDSNQQSDCKEFSILEINERTFFQNSSIGPSSMYPQNIF